jgi:hypothetical protein
VVSGSGFTTVGLTTSDGGVGMGFVGKLLSSIGFTPIRSLFLSSLSLFEGLLRQFPIFFATIVLKTHFTCHNNPTVRTSPPAGTDHLIIVRFVVFRFDNAESKLNTFMQSRRRRPVTVQRNPSRTVTIILAERCTFPITIIVTLLTFASPVLTLF